MKKRFMLSKVLGSMIFLIYGPFLEARELTKQTGGPQTIASPLVTTQTTSTIELEPIWEYQFKEPVVDVIFDETEMTVKEAKKRGWKNLEGRKDTERVKIGCPKIILVPEEPRFLNKEEALIKEVKFYDKKGNLIKKIVPDGNRVEFIRKWFCKNNYFILARQPWEGNYENGGGALYNNKGDLIWNKDTGPSPIAVSNEGYVIASILDWQVPPEPGTDFHLYDPEGNQIKIIENPNKKETSAFFAQFSNDGEYAILSFKACTYPPTVFVLITKKGEILWQMDFPDYRFTAMQTEIKIVPNVGVFGVVNDIDHIGYAYFIDWKGKLRWITRLDIKTAQVLKLSEDNKKVYIADISGYIWCIEALSGKILWKYKGNWPSRVIDRTEDAPEFREMEIYRENIYIIGKYLDRNRKRSDGRFWYSSTLFIFDSENGELVKKIEYPNKSISLMCKNNKIFILDIDAKKISQLKLKESKK